MSFYLNLIIVIALLAGITYEDFKYRSVKVYLFPALLIGLILYGINVRNLLLTDILVNFIMNISYIIILLSISFLYLIIVKKQKIKTLSHYVGFGDILFWIAISVWFEPVYFIIFNTISFTVAFCAHFILNRFVSYNRFQTIPLAGMQSFCFLIVLVINNPI
jgi:hypothetical protein